MMTGRHRWLSLFLAVPLCHKPVAPSFRWRPARCRANLSTSFPDFAADHAARLNGYVAKMAVVARAIRIAAAICMRNLHVKIICGFG